MMRFYGYFRSSSAHRCRIAFNLKGVSPDFVPVHLRRDGGEQKTAEYRSINAQALVPSLLVDGEVLTQSLAIIEWLDETVPQPPFLPTDPLGRARVRAFAQVIACDIHPLQNLRVLEYLKGELGQDQAGLERWCRRFIGDGLAACEALLRRDGGEGDFCFGDRPTLADICLVPQIHSARRFGVDLAATPRLLEVSARTSHGTPVLAETASYRARLARICAACCSIKVDRVNLALYQRPRLSMIVALCIALKMTKDTQPGPRKARTGASGPGFTFAERSTTGRRGKRGIPPGAAPSGKTVYLRRERALHCIDSLAVFA